jgi:hypothetical protein
MPAGKRAATNKVEAVKAVDSKVVNRPVAVKRVEASGAVATANPLD